MSSRLLVWLTMMLVTSLLGPCLTAEAQETLALRKQRLATMSDAQKTRLLEKKRRFDELSPVEQERLRDLHEQLTADEESSRLQGTLQRYSDWLKTLTPVVRAELAKLPPNERLVRVKKLMDAEATERFQMVVNEVLNSKELLSPRDLDIIWRWTDDFLVRHADEILEAVKDNQRLCDMLRKNDASENIHMLRFVYFRSSSWTMGKRGPESEPSPGPGRLGPPPAEGETELDPQRRGSPSVGDYVADLPVPSEAEEADLISHVSNQSQQVLQKAANPEERSWIIQRWMRAAMFSRFAPPVNREDMERFVRESLDQEERERLESLPRSDMYHELRRLYLRSRFQSGRRQKGGSGRRPDSFRGGGPRGRDHDDQPGRGDYSGGSGDVDRDGSRDGSRGRGVGPGSFPFRKPSGGPGDNRPGDNRPDRGPGAPAPEPPLSEPPLSEPPLSEPPLSEPPLSEPQ